MDDLNLELEALRAIYTEKELIIENNDDFCSVDIQITKERDPGFNGVNKEETLGPREDIEFIRIRLLLILDKDYPENSCPILKNVNITLFEGKYFEFYKTTFEEDGNNTNSDFSFEHNNDEIEINNSTIVCLNSDKVYNYYDEIKNDYIGRVCLFDIIETLLSFIYELPNDLNKQYPCSDLSWNIQYNMGSNNESTNNNTFGEDIDDYHAGDDKPMFSGLADRVLCSIEERVTTDEFNAWKEKFRAEMIEKNIWKGEYRELNVLTGRQLFERDSSLIKSDESSSAIEVIQPQS
ncbi:hypothetical protein FG379_003310 [Cryptosporidium bovis]|uniref:uncharacterized protein n=1 Tax=Cryptosporidium bovis TaxID=310047 RepID=UPI00351A1AFF|nr:hypothetical protein FG379_003310 [Cryptosporidium bovis]